MEWRVQGAIIQRFGYKGALRIALAAYCIRLGAYSLIEAMPSVWYVTPVELLHAVTFGIAWTAGVNFCNSEAPAGLQGSAQGLFSSLLGGFGAGVGGLLGGLLFQFYGGAVMYRIVLAFAFVSSAAIIAAEEILRL